MRTTYAVKWREPDEQVYVGRLELGPSALLLVGSSGGAEIDRQLDYSELAGLQIERLDGRRALALELPEGAYHLTSIVLEAGILQELADRLSHLSPAVPIVPAFA